MNLLSPESQELLSKYPEKDRQKLLEILSEGLKGDLTQTLAEAKNELWDDYETKPVPIEEWLESDYYLGEHVRKQFRPKWKEEITKVVNGNCIEWVLSGSIGSGKTFASIQLLLYKIHEVLCLKDPCKYYNAQSIVFGFFSIHLNLVHSVEYNMFKNFLTNSPYWKQIARLDIEEGNAQKVKKAIFNFPKNIQFAFGSRAVHALGQDIVAGLMDEVAFSTSLEAKQIIELYNNVKRRLESRYLSSSGRMPGILCVVSSANHEEDWLDKHIKAAKDKKLTHVTRFALYDVKPYDGDRFRVLVGDKLHRSRIIDTEVDVDRLKVIRTTEEVPPDVRVIEVPAHFYEVYRDDLEGSLRDISGIALFSASPLIPQREKILACVDDTRVHPFTVQEPVIDLMDDNSYIENFFEFDKVFEVVDAYRKVNSMKMNPGAPRFIGIDLAIKRDCIGFAVCHLSGLTETKRRDRENKIIKTFSPVITYDMVLRCRPPKGSESEIGKVRSFVFYLREMGMPIDSVGSDQWQSTDMHQIFMKEGIEGKKVPISRRPADPYLGLKQAIMEERIKFYEYTPLMDELRLLQYDYQKQKVDYNAVTGSHGDCADAVAGAYWLCMHSQYTMDRLNDATLLHEEKPYGSAPDKPNDFRNIRNGGWAYGDYEDARKITRYDPFTT